MKLINSHIYAYQCELDNSTSIVYLLINLYNFSWLFLLILRQQNFPPLKSGGSFIVFIYIFFPPLCCSDILLGLMKRLIKTRSSNLKVLITSATLDGVKVSKFFLGCPILNIPGTLFPVEKFYSTERPTNYIESALKTALGTDYILPS